MTEINWSLYPNFSESEFRCKHTGKCEMNAEFLELLQTIRYKYGKPMKITSGYRDVTHPIEARKAAPGAHAFGVAADIGVHGVDAFELIGVAIFCGVKRIGVSQKGGGRFIHLDVGDRIGFPDRRVWSY